MRILSLRRNFDADHSSSTYEFFALDRLTSEQREAVESLTGAICISIIRQVLDQRLGRVGELERDILFWLATAREAQRMALRALGAVE